MTDNKKGKDTFTSKEITILRSLIEKRINTRDQSKQKLIRDDMREIGFYGRDRFGIVGLTHEKFQKLIDSREIKIKD